MCPEHNVPYPRGATCPKCEDPAPEEDDDLTDEFKDDLPLPEVESEEIVEQFPEASEADYVNETWDTGLSDEELDTIQEVSEEFKAEREKLYNEKEKDENFKLSKTEWKEANPNETLKHYKRLYIHGVIDSLPWE